MLEKEKKHVEKLRLLWRWYFRAKTSKWYKNCKMHYGQWTMEV